MSHLRDKGPSERTPEWLIGLLIAVVVVTVGWFFLRSIGAGDDPVLGDDAPPGESSGSVDGDLLLYNGTPAKEFEGPLVVNFWASWCPACVVELPDFRAVGI